MSNESMNIKDYKGQLKQLCKGCPKREKCYKKKKLDNICLYKKFAFSLAKKKLKKQQRVNL